MGIIRSQHEDIIRSAGTSTANPHWMQEVIWRVLKMPPNNRSEAALEAEGTADFGLGLIKLLRKLRIVDQEIDHRIGHRSAR